MLSPPICNGFVEVEIAPVCAVAATCVPFTYNRSVDPSYVSVRNDHALAGSAEVPNASA